MDPTAAVMFRRVACAALLAGFVLVGAAEALEVGSYYDVELQRAEIQTGVVPDPSAAAALLDASMTLGQLAILAWAIGLSALLVQGVAAFGDERARGALLAAPLIGFALVGRTPLVEQATFLIHTTGATWARVVFPLGAVVAVFVLVSGSSLARVLAGAAGVAFLASALHVALRTPFWAGPAGRVPSYAVESVYAAIGGVLLACALAPIVFASARAARPAAEPPSA